MICVVRGDRVSVEEIISRDFLFRFQIWLHSSWWFDSHPRPLILPFFFFFDENGPIIQENLTLRGFIADTAGDLLVTATTGASAGT